MRLLISMLLAGWISSAGARSVAELVRQGDALDVQNKNAEALALYLEADTLRPDDSEILRRISKQYVQQLPDAGADPRALGEKAIAYGKRAVESGRKNAEAHLSLAIVYGKVAFLQAPKARMEFSRLIEREAQEAVALDARNDLAWHVLGRWNYEIANLSVPLKFIAQALYGKMPDASNERALECFEKAAALNPNRLVNQAELGRTLAILGRKDEARAALEKALAMPSREKDDEETKNRARKALAALE